MAKWSPGASNADWLLPPQWVLDEELPETPASVPAGNGMPELRPYTYRGADFSLPAEVTAAEPARRTRRKRGKPLNDPELLAAELPQSAPAWWLAEYERRGDL